MCRKLLFFLPYLFQEGRTNRLHCHVIRISDYGVRYPMKRNLDKMAHEIQMRILVHKWFCAVTFDVYLTGTD